MPADDEIIDDDTPRLDALRWASERFIAGDDGDDIRRELVAQGWDNDAAYDICEAARRQTQSQRGVETYNNAIEIARRRRLSSGGWLIGMPTLSAARRLFQALRALRSFRRR